MSYSTGVTYKLFNTKTTMQYTSYYNNFNSKKLVNSFDITQSINIFDNIRLDLGYQYKDTKSY